MHSIREFGEALSKRKLSALEHVDDMLALLDRLEPDLGCFVTVMGEQARRDARRLDAELARGTIRGALHGVTMTMKDIVHVAGVPNTGSSRLLAGFVPDSDAAVVRQLRQAGVIILGKTRLWELAMRSEDVTFGGDTRNPWNMEFASMGSSGGSAAAVAAGIGFSSVGTDTGGSIRGPASACGVVGFKPSYDVVSRQGVTPVSWTLDHVGVLARSVRDAAIVTAAAAGSTQRLAVPEPASSATPLPTVRIGICPAFFADVDPVILASVEAGLEVLCAAGARRVEVLIALLEEAQIAQMIITATESASVHERDIVARPEDFGPNNRSRTRLGATVLAIDYLRAMRVRRLFQEEMARAFEGCDVLVFPTSPAGVPRYGMPTAWSAGSASFRHATNRLRWPANLAGLPAITVPCGFDANGLPIGLQVVGPAGEDLRVLAVAAAYQDLTDWHLRRPPLCSA